MCMQMYLLALRGCLTFKIHGTASLPAAFPGSGACFQDCKDDWQMACREFLPSPCTILPGVRFSSSLPTPPCCSHPSCLFSAFCRASQAMCSNVFFQMNFPTVVKKEKMWFVLQLRNVHALWLYPTGSSSLEVCG